MLLNSNPSSFFIPDFVEIQRKSFFDLLEKGLINEIKKRNFISTPNNDVQLIFYPDYYQLNPPEWTPKQAILKSKSYTCRLYVPAQLINNLTKKINLQWVLLGNLPLMTKRGHFIINGSPRIIINQMVRSPGIYYQQTIDKYKKRSYYADLISHRGTWLRLETDKKQRVWARMKKTPKVSILIFLQSFGLTKERVFQSIHYSNFLKNSFLKQNHPISTEQALIALYSKAHPKKDKTEVTPEMGHKFLFRKFMNPRTYDLGKLGRLQLNKKLGLSVPLSIYTLTPQDILFAVDYLIKLEHGVGSIDDIDHLKNRRVRASGELVQNQLGTGLIRLEKIIREKLKKPKKNLTIRSLITTKPVNGALREFFGSSPLSQFMDQTNPLAEITHKRRLSSLGPGGVSRETAGMAVRGIHPSHYGRICPIETPEGPNAGLVNSITTYARINSEGFLETPFYNVSQGQIQKKQSPIFFSAEHEENLNVAPGDLKSNILNFLPKNLIPIRNSDEFKLVSRDQVHYIAISPIQMISIATSLIPFLEHDDANRALMGSNMQRQAVPLIAPERPVIGTGLEARVVSDSGHIIQAENSGFVSYVSGDKITIQTFFPLKFNSPEISSYRKSFDSRMFTQEERHRSSFDSRMITHDSNRVLTPYGLPFPLGRELCSSQGYQEEKTKKFDSNRVFIQEDLKNLRFSESLDSLKFSSWMSIHESNNNLFWNQYDLSKRAISRNKREFLIFNFKYKIQNHFVTSIRTGELLSLLMCQTKNILNFSNTVFYREINKPSLLVSKNALQINLSWLPSNRDCLVHPKEESLDSNIVLDPYGTIGNGLPFGNQEANQCEFLFQTKKAQIGNNYTNLTRLEQSLTISDGSPLWATFQEPRGEFGISKKKFVNRLIILNSQKTYFQSLIKTFLFDFFNKKLTSFYLRSWNSFFIYFIQKKTVSFFALLMKISNIIHLLLTRTEFSTLMGYLKVAKRKMVG
uniref:DNA-directed RNA polymerase n=1 Tax=Neocystis brevis TaxID=1065496 RepID=A0A097KML9_9CHLO|nr:beta subunit of RNA polymerase [Neocystis brevis]AIT94436.1 beta subunit of RNA polymerase [Neocystis brevis]